LQSPNYDASLGKCNIVFRASGCDIETAVAKLSLLGDAVCSARVSTCILSILKSPRYFQGFTEISKKDGKPQARGDDGGDSSPVKRSPLKSAGWFTSLIPTASLGS
jgi:hypothetical protein